MAVPIFSFLATLESDIADFYRRLKSVSRLVRSDRLFDFMANHSSGHSQEIMGLAERHARPELDQAFIREVHEKIKVSLMAEIRNAPDLGEAVEKIARTEELVGKMYQMVAAHYRRLAEHCLGVAGDLDRIASEEFQHRDMVLKERERYGGEGPA